jgi:chromosomal replication initiator protein
VQLIWEEFLKIIKEEAGSQVVETWFKAVVLEEWDALNNAVSLRVPNQFVSRWIQDHYAELLKTHLARLLHAPITKLQFTCSAQPTTHQRPRTIIPASVAHDMHPQQGPMPPPHQSHYQPEPQPSKTTQLVPRQGEALVQTDKRGRTQNRINPVYVFDNFIVGPNNSLAHAAAQAICQNVGRVYNPLFIYGGTGLGKTHLLHAIGNEVLRRNPSTEVRYETSDNFVNEFINAIRFERPQYFRNKYQKIDVFLLDDIQFFSNKEQTQEAFFHIFNILHEQQKQIVLSSDTFPKEITGLQSRLKSRMEWGLVADIQIPDLETKTAILKKKADQHTIILPDEVADFIASRVISNIRELEGALIRVSAFASLTNQPINLELARKVLLNLSESSSNKRESVILDNILKVVAKHYDTSVNDLRSKKRHQDIAAIRQIVFYMMKKMSNCSLQIIGSYVGGRDHSTVIHAVNKVERLIGQDHELTQKIRLMEQEIISL